MNNLIAKITNEIERISTQQREKILSKGNK
jgi:hypothetical protein